MVRYEYVKINKPEILAPAGNFESAQAAVKAGADAVYLGGNLFSARAFAGNFTEDKLIEAIDYCHLYGVKVYMAVNTLLKEKEIGNKNLVQYVKPFYHEGVDGIIVQDMGVASVLKDAFSDLPLHGSTQMSISSSYGAKFLKDFGFTRVVPARELSLEEIKAIKEKVNIEIETFVHGAMCFSYSGRCLLSSFSGGRSGNRGRCAQPCRQCYEIFNTGEKEKGPSVHEYIMSLKDMCTLKILPKLIDGGIDSFKIEGRMKKPEYVAAAVDAYKRARDFYYNLKNKPAVAEGKYGSGEVSEGCGFAYWNNNIKQEYFDFTEQLEDELKDIYNRGGFCTGYYMMEKGKMMFASERPNHEGLKVGNVESVAGPDVKIILERSVNKGDVLEVRTGDKSRLNPESRNSVHDVELTCNVQGNAESCIILKGKDLRKIKPGMAVYRTKNNFLLERINRDIIEPEKTIEAHALIIARIGEPLTIVISKPAAGKIKQTEYIKRNLFADDGFEKKKDYKKFIEITVRGKEVEPAANNPTTAEQLLEKMKKTGGTGITLKTVCDIDHNAFISMGGFNELRRQAVEEFKKAVISGYYR